jgi:hypothetical protein
MLRGAVKELRAWVDARYGDARNRANQTAEQYDRGCWRGEQVMCSKIRNEMRTLFAGLIDFDE